MTTLTGQEAYSLDICPRCEHRVDAHRGHGCTWCGCSNNADDARNAAVALIIDRRVTGRAHGRRVRRDQARDPGWCVMGNACDHCGKPLPKDAGGLCTLCGEEYERLLQARHDEWWNE